MVKKIPPLVLALRPFVLAEQNYFRNCDIWLYEKHFCEIILNLGQLVV